RELIERFLLLGQDLTLSNFTNLEEGKLSSAMLASAIEGYSASGTSDGDPVDDASDDTLRQRVSELTALHRINSAANSSLNLGDMLNETAQAVVAVTGADMCSIFLYESEWDQLVLTATSGPNQDAVGKVRLQLGEGITGWAAFVGKPVAVKDAWSDPRFKYVPSLEEDRAISMLAVPVVLFTKEKLLGVITVHTYEERDFTENGIRFLETVAGEIAIAIENARLYEQTDARLQQKVAELSTLQGVSAHIAATLNLPEVLTQIAYQAARLVHADAAAIYEMHPDARILELVAQYDLKDPNHSIYKGKSNLNTALSIEKSTIAQAIIRGIPVPLAPNSDAELDLPFASDDYKSMFCVPLVAPRNIMGGICLYNIEERSFSEEQVRLLDAFAHEAAIALENSRLYDAALRGLRIKSAMLQEMNHRVRNNLQTVAGLLSMQLRRMRSNSEAAVAVRESISRVQSMAAVHDLMTSGDVESISLHELARKVTEAAISTLSKPGFDLKLEIAPETEQIRVGSHEATLLALLFNELASNTILHGFADREKGSIEIRAWVEQNGTTREVAPENTQTARVYVQMSDDGVGLPKGFDPQKDAHLGLNIVHTLVVSDLRGDFKLERGAKGRGTAATISFMTNRIKPSV
ncbi:MAG: GAF domain-containing protein, partial [Chloroflexia bacterium]